MPTLRPESSKGCRSSRTTPKFHVKPREIASIGGPAWVPEAPRMANRRQARAEATGEMRSHCFSQRRSDAKSPEWIGLRLRAGCITEKVMPVRDRWGTGSATILVVDPERVSGHAYSRCRCASRARRPDSRRADLDHRGAAAITQDLCNNRRSTSLAEMDTAAGVGTAAGMRHRLFHVKLRVPRLQE